MNSSQANPPSPTYEDPAILAQYLLFHYGRDEQILPWKNGPTDALQFPQRCATEGIDPSKLSSKARALDIGCAVGRSTFELARIFDEVIGLDYSHQFIAAANALKSDGARNISILETGSNSAEARIQVPPELDRSKVQFHQADAHAIDPALGAFDAVLCCNLLCRLHTPQRLLDALPRLVKPGGQLFITTPETWMEQYTPKENWLSGREGESSLLETLRDRLGGMFMLDSSWEMPFLIREHRRKYQWSVAQASRWIRK